MADNDLRLQWMTAILEGIEAELRLLGRWRAQRIDPQDLGAWHAPWS